MKYYVGFYDRKNEWVRLDLEFDSYDAAQEYCNNNNNRDSEYELMVEEIYPYYRSEE